jgi:hypothetical protein
MVPDLDVILEVVPAPVRGKGAVEFDDREWHVLSLLNGYRSVVDVAAASNLSDIETCSVLCRLLERGVIRPKAFAVKEEANPPGGPSGAEALLAVYNELFAQVFFAVSEEAGADASRELNDATTVRSGASSFLAGCWAGTKGVLNRESVLRNFLAADPETREEELAAALFDLFRYELSLTATLLTRPRQAALIQDLQPLAALLLKKYDSKLVNVGARRVLSRFLSPTEVSYAERE